MVDGKVATVLFVWNVTTLFFVFTDIEVLRLQRPPLYLWICNITKGPCWHLSISGGFEQDGDGKSCDCPFCMQCCNFSLNEFIITQKVSLDTSQYQEALSKMAWEKFLLSDSYPLGCANPTSKNFSDAMDIVYIVYCTIYIVFMHFMQTNLWIANAYWWCRRLELIKEVKAFGKKGKKTRRRRLPEVFRFNGSAVGIQRKRVQLAECDLARSVSAVALKRVHLVRYFILTCFILYYFLAKGQWLCWPSKESIWCSILFSLDDMSVELQALTWKWKY